MSTETHVFFRGKLPTKVALSRAMKELGFPLPIKPATGSLEQQSGFMPMTLRREETGVEFDVFDDRSAVEEYAGRGSTRATSGSPTSAGAATSRRRSPACAPPRRLPSW